MPDAAHLFELYLTPLDEGRFTAIATQSTLGSNAEAESALPFWAVDQDWRTTVIKVLESSRGYRSANFPDPAEQAWMQQAGILAPNHPSFAPDYLERIGQALFQALLPPGNEVGQAFQAALHHAEAAGLLLHLRLKFAAKSAQWSRLADYPWELIHDGQRFLLERRVQLSRYIAYGGAAPRQPLGDRLRVLLVSPRASDVGHLSDGEPQAIQSGIAKAEAVSVDTLPTPTWRGLSTYLTETDTPPQVIHFDGHGIFGKRCRSCHHLHHSTKVEACQQCGAPLPESQGFLAFEDEQGKAEFVSAQQLGNLVVGKGIALAVLSACQSGMAIAGKSVFNGTAQQLIDAQIPAVVAMQYSVQVRAARDFAEQFYRVLGQGGSALAAVQAGRAWMGSEGNQWYRPVLYLRWQENHHGELFVKPEPQPSVRPKPATARSRPQPLGLAAQLELQDLQAQLVQLQAEYQACQEAARTTLDPDSKIKLQTKGQKILADISRIGERIEALQSGSGA